MSNKPIHLVAAQANGKPYGRRAVWAMICELGSFTQLELRARLPQVTEHVVREYVNALVKAGYVIAGARVPATLSTGRERQYKLARNTGIDAPRLRKDGSEIPPTKQQQMWMAMRVLGWFTPATLAMAASTPSTPVAESAAEDYIWHLCRAGYLQISENEPTIYRMEDDTGGLAPMVQRTKVVFDLNTNTLRWHEEMEP